MILSVIKQNYTKWELIIINDGSKDNSISIISKYLNDKRIKLYNLKKNFGVNYARNYAISKCSYEWLSILDSDNVLNSKSLEKFNESINKFPKIYMHKFMVKSFNGRLLCDKLNDIRLLNYKEFFLNKLKGENHTLINKNFLERTLFFENLNGGERLTWNLIAKELDAVIYHPFISLIYDEYQNNRLSIKNKFFYIRVSKIYFHDIKIHFIDYLKYSPNLFLIKIIKLSFYFMMSLFK